ncbi:MAG: heme NO-binding domain-containing protein [Crocinitomicaceae bacterium]
MKGLVFTELIEMIEDQFGLKVADDMIQKANVPNKGAYTGVGTYPHSEMVSLVNALSESTGIETSKLYQVYGEHLFGRFRALYGHFFSDKMTAFDFLESVDHYIHKEVKKLYPDAELPEFNTIEKTTERLITIYKSERKMSDFAYGLIKGCMIYYKENVEIEMDPISETEMKFTIVKVK